MKIISVFVVAACLFVTGAAAIAEEFKAMGVGLLILVPAVAFFNW